MKSVRRVPVALVAAVVLGAVHLAGASEARAANVEVIPLEFAHYDHAVAESNGFRIVTNADGQEVSEPVSDEAKALVAKQSRHTVIGRCGSASLNLARVGGTRQVFFSTGYKVPFPTIYHNWTVDLTRGGQQWSTGLNGGPTTGSWSTSRTITTNNNQGVRGIVRAGSHAYLTNGAVCFAGSPNSST